MLIALALGFTSSAATATIYRFVATLDQAQEVPPPASVPFAFGNGSIFYDDVTGTLEWFVSFGSLSGAPTEPAPGAGTAHIHVGAPGAAGPALVSLGAFVPVVPGMNFGVYLGSGVLGSLLIPPATVPSFSAALLAGHTYFNVHTALNPAGEIRGQLVFHSLVVPLPPAVAMLLSGIALLAVRGFRRVHRAPVSG